MVKIDLSDRSGSRDRVWPKLETAKWTIASFGGANADENIIYVCIFVQLARRVKWREGYSCWASGSEEVMIGKWTWCGQNWDCTRGGRPLCRGQGKNQSSIRSGHANCLPPGERCVHVKPTQIQLYAKQVEIRRGNKWPSWSEWRSGSSRLRAAVVPWNSLQFYRIDDSIGRSGYTTAGFAAE